MKVLWRKKEKLQQENPSYLFNSKKSDEKKNPLEATRGAGDGARLLLSLVLIVAVIRTFFWVSEIRANLVFALVIKAALCSCCCLEVSRHANWTSRL